MQKRIMTGGGREREEDGQKALGEESVRGKKRRVMPPKELCLRYRLGIFMDQ